MREDLVAVHHVEGVIFKRQLVSIGNLEGDPIPVCRDAVFIGENFRGPLEHDGIDIYGGDMAAGGADNLGEGGRYGS